MKCRFSTLFLVLTLLLAGCTRTESNPRPPSDHVATSCVVATEQDIASLFDRWNQSLQTGDPQKVVANYAERSILLPTVSRTPCVTRAEKEDYFHYFLEKQPSGEINLRQISIGCNMAVDSGYYTFSFAKTGERVQARYSFTYQWDGTQWLIVSHHSSLMPDAGE